ncbi:predicted protein [Naegleria gruberi]|uniref:Predicted protein n=1 Tax=Naegleria gruberi TaxID=5762 RepID=D2VBA4_NAEGR|nr:uncharacterized protein NAEGRDRAFT_66146 [Naegleria gruberi]EFC45760.1 predicted protein [Naegleria gruberi]|eukprot:XP_002678504.1 predicted protein [Naegleria gruberi strain NEG-M]
MNKQSVVLTFAVICLFFIHNLNAIWPSQIIDLRNWKLTLPVGEPGDAMEIKQPTLDRYSLNPYFGATTNNTGVRFRVLMSNVTVTTSSNTKYARSELREMDSSNPSSTKAAWNTTVGTHTMIIDQTITRLPTTRKKVIAGQVHDADEYVVTIHLEGTKLYINIVGVGTTTISQNYIVGTRFQIKIQVKNGVTSIYYNNMNTPIYSITKSYKGAYFKAGCYAQSNCEFEGSLCGKSNNYAEVVIHNLTITHEYPSVQARNGILNGWFANMITSDGVSFGTSGLIQLVYSCLLVFLFVIFA